MNHKEITIGPDARLKIKAGIDKAVAAVAPTLGVVGMSAIIHVPGLQPLQSDDGVTILKHLEFSDPYEQIGLELLREAALRTSREGGDGTATTTVLTGALVSAALHELSDSSRTREIRERLSAGLAEALRLLGESAREVGTNVQKIAEISSLDPEIAELIADAISSVGIHGVITVEKGTKLGYSSEVVKGSRFDRGYVSPFFITDPERQEAVLEYPYIVLIDRKISTNEQIVPLLQSIGTGTEILIIADDIDSVALGTLAHNAFNKIAKIVAVKNPYTGQRAQDFLYDIAALTGATVISETRGMKLDEATKDLCGKCDKVIVTRDKTTIVGGSDESDHKLILEQRVEALKTEIENCPSQYEKKNLEDRLATLTGGIGVIRVGTYTDTDFAAKKLKFDNGIAATQAALQEGILIGGGSALLKVALDHSDHIFQKALMAPYDQQFKNANCDDTTYIPDVHTDEILDFKTKQTVNAFEAGIVDPHKVVRLALESAVAIASTLITAETVIVKLPDEPTK